MQSIGKKLCRHVVSIKAASLQYSKTPKPKLLARPLLIPSLQLHKPFSSNNRQPPPKPPNDTSPWKLFLGAATISAFCAAFVNLFVSIKKEQALHQKQSSASPIRAFKVNNNAALGLNLRDRFNFINKVVEKCAPAVVYVEIRDPRKIDKGTDNSLIVSNGSGFIVTEDGWILTNAHVVINRPNATVQVKLQNGETYTASVEDADMNIDLALIKIDPPDKLPALRLARSGDVNVGEWVVALGSPLSLSHSATAGVVSCVNRNADELGLRNFQMRYIQTDAPITFGNSGGPLVNLDGEVIGINNLRITAGISFAIPVEFVEKFLSRLQSNHRQLSNDETYLGITAITLNEDIMENVATKYNFTSNETQKGVFVWKIMADSTGEKVGLKVGDIITHVNGRTVACPTDIYEAIDKAKRFSLALVRDGKPINILVDAIGNNNKK